jgi:predicted nuclease of predicted toxin-antitoxin system
MPADLHFLFDENVHGDIVEGFNQRNPSIDAVRAQDVGLRSANDETVLEWAAANDRIVISVDKRTLPADAWVRVKQGLPMPGVVILRISLTIGTAIKELEVVAHAGVPEDFERNVVYLPL